MVINRVKCNVAGLILALTTLSHAQVSLTSTSYSQNFDSLSSTGTTQATANPWQNNTTLAGWYLYREMPVGNFVAGTNYMASDGHDGTQYFFSHGSLTGPSVSDRALGSIAGANSTLGGTFYYGMGFTNSLLATITDVSIAYRQETWRVGSSGITDIVNFQFSLNANGINDQTATWQNLDSLDMIPNILSPTGGRDGNTLSVVRQGSLSSLLFANGQTLWIRWFDRHTAGSQHGLAIDDLQVDFTTDSGGNGATTTPEPFTMALTGLGAAAVLRRKLKAKQKPATS